MIPLLLEIYFLGWINDSIRIRSDVKFYSSTSGKVVVFFFSREETILKIDDGLPPPCENLRVKHL